jgi:Peptidase family M23
MRPPRRFNLLIVRGDGTPVLRLGVRKSVALAALGGAVIWTALSLVSLGYMTDYFGLRLQRRVLESVLPSMAQQQAHLDLYERRIRDLRAEIDGWRDVYAKIWAPFGPDVGPGKRGLGIGGGTSAGPTRPDPPSVADELARLTAAVQEQGDNLRSLEEFIVRASKLLAALPSRWPLRGPVNSEYGNRASPWNASSEFHGGIDIGASVGTPVRAPAPGTVVFAGRMTEYGVTLIIEHANETRSVYGHLSKLNVKADQRVERGDLIAWSGNTGRSSGPHLHYEIQVKGQPVNPNTYLWE